MPNINKAQDTPTAKNGPAQNVNNVDTEKSWVVQSLRSWLTVDKWARMASRDFRRREYLNWT